MIRTPAIDTAPRASDEIAERPSIATRLLLFFSMFLILFGPKLFNAGDMISLVSGFAILVYLMLLKNNKHIRPRGSWRFPVALFYVLFTYSLIVILTSKNPEFFHTIRFARVLLNYLGVLALCGIYYYTFGATFRREILLHVFLAITLHAVIMELQFASNSFRYWTYSWIGIGNFERIGKRVTGLTLSFNTLAMVQGFGLVIAPVVLQRWPRKIPTILFYICLALQVPALLLAGRTAAYIMVAMALVTFAVTYLNQTSQNRIGQVMGLVMVPIGLFIFVRILSPLRLEILQNTVFHLMEPMNSFEMYGDIRVQTWEVVLRTMYFLPDNWKDTFFGSGISGRGGTYVASDVGYVLTIFGIGLLGLGIVIAFYVFALVIARKYRRFDPLWSLVSFLLVLAVVALNAKENVMLTRHGFTLTCIMLCVWFFYSDSPLDYLALIPLHDRQQS